MKTQLIKKFYENVISFQETKSISQVKEIYKDIIEQDNVFFDENHLLGLYYYNQKEYENSINSIKKAIEQNPDKLEFYINLGNSYCALKEYEKAKLVYEKVIDKDPSFDMAYHSLGLLYKEKREYKEALYYYKKAIKLNKKSYIYHYHIANVYSSLCKYELSLFYLQKVIKLCPEFYYALYEMAKCYKNMKNEKKMFEYLHKTLEVLPKHAGANHMLASQNNDTKSIYSSQYAKKLFDQYADYFEDHLMNSLKYKVPFIIKEKLETLDSPRDSKVLDLGCGTGLLGKNIVEQYPDLEGVDISVNMIEETRKKDIYNTLYTDDIYDFLVKNTQEFNLIIAADVFIYIGGLKAIFSTVRKSLSSDGYFIFTIELFSENNNENFQLAKNGRFSHTMEYVEILCKDTGFEVIEKEEIILREQNKVGQKGAIFILKPFNPK